MRELIYSLNKDDFIIQTFAAGGKGGQKQNACNTGVRIIHPASGARGEARDERSQLQNKKLAFKRLVESKEFQLWHKKMVGRILLSRAELEQLVEEAMRPENLKIEYGPFEE